MKRIVWLQSSLLSIIVVVMMMMMQSVNGFIVPSFLTTNTLRTKQLQQKNEFKKNNILLQATSSENYLSSSSSTQQQSTSSDAFDWSFLDAAYLITCPNADPNSERLNTAKEVLGKYGLTDEIVKVKEFQTDDQDRIRGCYTSHISVLKDALQDIQQDNNEKKNGIVLVLEDNIASSNTLTPLLLQTVSRHATTTTSSSWDMIHLSYIPYVPNLSVLPSSFGKELVSLQCGIGSALGTTAYLITRNAMENIIRHDTKEGYYAPIPDVMAQLFPSSRFAISPTPFVRAPFKKSLVNPQLDDLRTILFQPSVTTLVQSLLVNSGLETNLLLILTILTSTIIGLLSAIYTIQAFTSLITTSSLGDYNLFLAMTSFVTTFFLLGILIQGIRLAPKPPATTSSSNQQEEQQKEE